MSRLEAKIVLLGATSVGKTSIISRAVADDFDVNVPSTIGACYATKETRVSDVTIILQIWDTAGQERFRTLTPMYYRNAIAALLVFSIIDESSLENIQRSVDEMKKQTSEMPELFVVGNKSDLNEERKVAFQRGIEAAEMVGAHYHEVSAKTGEGIEELILEVGKASVEKKRKEARISRPSVEIVPVERTGKCDC
jgi:small GTP-binding protein